MPTNFYKVTASVVVEAENESQAMDTFCEAAADDSLDPTFTILAEDGTEPTTLTVTAERHDDTLFAGLRQAWIDGNDPGTGLSFDLTCGAGLNSPYLVLSVKLADGTRINETIDIRPVLTAWVQAVTGDTETTLAEEPS